MTLVKRRIDLQFKLGKGSFGEDGSDTVSLTGLRTSAAITKSGGVSMSELNLRVWGIPLDVMNKLSLLGKPLLDGRFNLVTVAAGDDKAGVSVCFVGIITEAWIDFEGAPDVSLVVTAHTGLLDALKPTLPISYDGSVDVATVIAGIAAQMNPPRALENSGVALQISNPYLVGSLLDQLRSVARGANINCLVDDTVIAIWPAGGTRNGLVPLISPATGMIGYPTRTDQGIAVRMLYNPSVIFGGQIQIESDETPAKGAWVVYAVGHDLEAELPGGKWFTRVDCSLLGRELPIVR